MDDKVKQNIIKEYTSSSTISIVYLSKKYEISKSKVKEIILKSGNSIRTPRKYETDEYFFHNLNSEDKFYILGLLFSDGCNIKNRYVYLGLMDVDFHILKSINDLIQPNKPILFSKRAKPDWHDRYHFQVNSAIMAERLSELGCIPNKSLILKFPNYLEDYQLRHFLRGYMDGDGSIGENSSYFLGTEDFCRSAKSKIEELLKITCRIRKIGKIYELSIGGRLQMVKFLSWLYEDCNLKLERKYNKYLKAKNRQRKLAPNSLINENGERFSKEQKRIWKNQKERMNYHIRKTTISFLEGNKDNCACGESKNCESDLCKNCYLERGSNKEWPQSIVLFKILWDNPLHISKKELNSSESSIRNYCNKINLPLPGNKYWCNFRKGNLEFCRLYKEDKLNEFIKQLDAIKLTISSN